MTATVTHLPSRPTEAATEIPPQAFALAAAYREAGKGPQDVAPLARLFDAVPHMETLILAAWDTLDRLETAGA